MHFPEASHPAHPQISESACCLVFFVSFLSVHGLGQKKKKFKASKKYRSQYLVPTQPPGTLPKVRREALHLSQEQGGPLALFSPFLCPESQRHMSPPFPTGQPQSGHLRTVLHARPRDKLACVPLPVYICSVYLCMCVRVLCMSACSVPICACTACRYLCTGVYTVCVCAQVGL